MMGGFPQPCLGGCGQLVRGRSRCADCEGTVYAGSTKRARSRASALRSKLVRAAWVREHGWTCPGWGHRPPHPSHDLTLHHLTRVVEGGQDGPVTVLCRACNSAANAAEQESWR
jgi:hypothetical protein